MPESISNVEFAQKIHEQGHRDGSRSAAGRYGSKSLRRRCSRSSLSRQRGVATRPPSGMLYRPHITRVPLTPPYCPRRKGRWRAKTIFMTS